MSGIIWEEPPARHANRGFAWQPIADALRQRPGAWACVRVYPPEKKAQTYTAAGAINANRIKALPAQEFEARAFTDGSGGKVYARFIGGDHR